jgi:hypothetical protein
MLRLSQLLSALLMEGQYGVTCMTSTKATAKDQCGRYDRDKINLQHYYIKSQIEWFRAGSVLNILRSKEINYLAGIGSSCTS